MDSAEATARAKSELRLKARAARRALTPEQRVDAANRVALAIMSLPQMRDARAVLSYKALPEELDLGPTMDRMRSLGVRVALPRIGGPCKLQLHWHEPDDALVMGEFGLLEPLPEAAVAPVAAIDVVLTPGVAYDRNGWRLGFGGGYYDTLFRELDSSVVRLGIAYDEQVVDELPKHAHDLPVDIVVTPLHVYRARTSS